MKKAKITVVGSFIADLAFYTPRFPRDGESIIGNQLIMGPGGKGSNAATAASRSGGEITMVTKVGRDDLANIAYSHSSLFLTLNLLDLLLSRSTQKAVKIE